mgnify:CR=1 FL=1
MNCISGEEEAVDSGRESARKAEKAGETRRKKIGLASIASVQ